MPVTDHLSFNQPLLLKFLGIMPDVPKEKFCGQLEEVITGWIHFLLLSQQLLKHWRK